MENNFKKLYAWGRLWTLSPLKEYALGFLERRKLEIWMLLQLFPYLEYNNDFSMFMIPNLSMPKPIKQLYSRLLVFLPIKNNENSSFVYPNIPPDSFYIDADLQDEYGNYVLNILRGLDINLETYNDMQEEGYARFLLPINKWEPTWDIISGDNLVTLVKKIVHNISLFGR